MKAAIAFTLLSVIALLVPSSARPKDCGCNGVSGLSVRSSSVADASDVKSASESQSEVVSNVGGVLQASGKKESSYSEDKDTANKSEKEYVSKDAFGNTVKAKQSSSSTTSSDVDKSSSSSYSTVAVPAC